MPYGQDPTTPPSGGYGKDPTDAPSAKGLPGLSESSGPLDFLQKLGSQAVDTAKTLVGQGSPESEAQLKQLGTQAREFVTRPRHPFWSAQGKVMGEDPATMEHAAGVALSFNPANLGAKMMTRELVKPSTPRPEVLTAHEAGYVLHPQEITGDPVDPAKAAASAGGKTKVWQQASVRNQEVTNRLAAEDVGLPPGQAITPGKLSQLRGYAGKTYDAVRAAIPDVYVGQAFHDRINNILGASAEAAKKFPGIFKTQEIDNLINSITSAKWPISTDVLVETVKQLRFEATANLRNRGEPTKLALGLAQREVAHAMEDALEVNVTGRAQNPDLVNQYKAARQLIAKTHDIEDALNLATGDVRANRIASLASRGRPFTGGLKTIADTAMAFPKDMQNPATFGGHEDWSILDVFSAAVGAATGHLGIAAVPLMRPLARGAALSQRSQSNLINPRPASVPAAVPGFVSVLGTGNDQASDAMGLR